MFTKYFGLFLIAGGIFGALYSLLFNGIFINRNTENIQFDQDLPFGILIAIAIILVTFFIGRYFYKAGQFKSEMINLKIINNVDRVLAKYFGLFLIVGAIGILFYSFLIAKLSSVNGGGPFSVILIPIPAILATFFIGRYFYNIGSIEKNSENLGIKFIKIAAILFIVSILIISISFFITLMIFGPSMGDGWALMLVFFFGIVPAMAMSGIAIILLVIHWLKNRAS